MNVRFDESTSVLYLQPEPPLKSEDFQQVEMEISKHSNIKGIIIETMKFPGWVNFDAFKTHMKFIKNNQSKVSKIALVTNSPMGFFAENVVSLFLHPKIKHFPFGQVDAAKQWMESND